MNSDTEMGDDTLPSAITTLTELRRTSAASTASSSHSNTSGPTSPRPAPSGGHLGAHNSRMGPYPPHSPSSGREDGGGSTATSRRSSLANLVHDMDVGDEEDEVDDDDDEDAEEGEGGQAEEVEAELEAEEDDDEDDDDDEEDDEEDDDEASESETDVPTTSRGRSSGPGDAEEAGPASPPSSRPTPAHQLQPPPPNTTRSSISISDLTENGVAGPLPSPSMSNGSTVRKGISIPVLIHSTPQLEGPSGSSNGTNATPGPNGGITVTAMDGSTSGAAASASPAASLPPGVSGPSAITAVDSGSVGGEEGEPSSKKPPSKSAKPRSKHVKHRTPSPSPPPALPPPPVQTIRLDIKLGGPTNYEIDISRKAKETGQRDPTPPPLLSIHGRGSESEREEVEEKVVPEVEEDGKKKKRKKKNAGQEYYDTSDPFIDDSELAVDQRTYFAQTKQQGFYVSSGEVALLKDKSPKKPKSKKPILGLNPPTASQQASSSTAGTKKEGGGEGTRDSPIALLDGEESPDTGFSKGLKGVGIANGKQKAEISGHELFKFDGEEDGDERAGQKRKRYITVLEGGKKRKIVNISSFHPELQTAIENLKQLIGKESWEQKGKFPPGLKPQLAQLALLAIRLDEYDDHFFNLMPTLFPYNKFTMTKLIKRTVYADHVALLQERQETLLAQLEELSKAGFARAEEEWEKSVTAWDKRQEKMRLEAAANPSGTGDSGSAPGSAAPTRHPTEEKEGMEVDTPGGSISVAGGGGGGAPGQGAASAVHGQHPPAKKFRLTEQMKGIIWDLVLLSNECCRLENEKNAYEGSVIQVSEQGLRKVLYQKIVAAFPDGWMSSGQISRDVSAMKKKLEKEAMETES